MNHPNLQYGSVCSGIEAVSLAWKPLGWHPAWFSEIDPFPNAVLAHHYPDVPNLGDMTGIADQILAGTAPAPDILVGGTPCQAFSVAGARGGLSDPRGALTLKYTELVSKSINSPRSSSGKTSPASSPTNPTPLDAFWGHWPAKAANCNQQGPNGRTQVVCLDTPPPHCVEDGRRPIM